MEVTALVSLHTVWRLTDESDEHRLRLSVLSKVLSVGKWEQKWQKIIKLAAIERILLVHVNEWDDDDAQ